jgi:hypothetical protein
MKDSRAVLEKVTNEWAQGRFQIWTCLKPWSYEAGSNHRGGDASMAAGETPTLLGRVERSAVVSTAGTWASSPKCCQGRGRNPSKFLLA